MEPEVKDSMRFEPRFREVPDVWNLVTERIIGCAIEVHSILGPGLVERVYEDAMEYEFRARGMPFQRQRPVRVRYKEIELSEQRMDLVVEDLVVVELKCVERVSDANLAQLMSYMRAADLPLGLLINFGDFLLTKGVFRRINNGSSRFGTFPAPLRASRSSSPSAF